MLKDAVEPIIDNETDDVEASDIYCAACSHVVTQTDWRRTVAGAHEHTFFNPAGIVFRALCFREAPGIIAVGAPSREFSWFAGYAWRIALCGGCGTHLGWLFADTDAFFGLIKPKLTMVKPT